MATKKQANAVEQELLKATGIKRRVAEKFEAYAKRISDKAQDLSDDEWASLSTEAATWVNDAAKAVTKGEEPPAFPDAGDGDGEKAAPAPASKKGAKTAAAPAKGNSTGEAKRPGAYTKIKQLMVKDPTMTSEKLIEKLNKAGYEMTPIAVSSIRSDFRHSMRILKEAGLLAELEL